MDGGKAQVCRGHAVGGHTHGSISERSYDRIDIISSMAWMHRSSGAMHARTACDSVFETTYVRAWGPLSSERDQMKSHSQSEVRARILDTVRSRPSPCMGATAVHGPCSACNPLRDLWSGVIQTSRAPLPALPLSLLNWPHKFLDWRAKHC